MPPMVSDCAVSTTPRNTTLRKPKMSSNSAIDRSGSNGEGNVATRDMAVDREHLPAQPVAAGAQAVDRCGERIGCVARRQPQRMRAAVGEDQRQPRPLGIDAAIEA